MALYKLATDDPQEMLELMLDVACDVEPSALPAVIQLFEAVLAADEIPAKDLVFVAADAARFRRERDWEIDRARWAWQQRLRAAATKAKPPQ